MRTITLFFVLVLTSFSAFADNNELNTENLVCGYRKLYNSPMISCVSKASIERDTLQIAILKLEKEKLEKQLNKVDSKKK